MGKGRLLDEVAIKEIATEYNKTPAQILIRWSLQNGVVTIPKSIKKQRVHENMQVIICITIRRRRFDFSVSNKYQIILQII